MLLLLIKKMLNRLINLIKHNREVKFLIVGGYNTAFGLGFGNLCYYFLELPYPVIALTVYVVSVLNSYFSYEFFVFKTKQNRLKGLMKANATYLLAFLINLLLMFVCINLLGMNRVLAFNLVSAIVVTMLYFLHRHFTFA